MGLGGSRRTMLVGLDTLNLQPVIAPTAPPPRAQAPIEPVGEREATSRDPREQSRGERHAAVDFRSFLTASTLEGLTRTLGGGEQVAGDGADSESQSPPSKVPDAGPAIFSGAEAANYYRALSGESESLASAREFRDATTSYARNFFAASGVYARPGESLELSA